MTPDLPTSVTVCTPKTAAHRRPSRRTRSAALVLAPLLFLAACGGSDEASEITTVSTTEPAETTSTTIEDFTSDPATTDSVATTVAPPTETVVTDDTAAPTTDAAAPDTNPATATSEPNDATIETTTVDETDTATTEAAAPAAQLSIPSALRGDWRESQNDEILDGECDTSNFAVDNFGQILSIGSDGFSYFESGGRLIEVYESSDTRLDAEFDTTYADEPTQGRFVFDRQGDVLTVAESGASSVRYLRCP